MNQFIIIKSSEGEIESVSYSKEVIENMKPSFFNSVSEGIHYLGSDLIKEGRIIAFADLNNDKMTDIITYKEELQKFSFFANFYIYDEDDNGKFSKKPLFSIETPDYLNATVRNVHVGSFFENNNDKFCMIVSFDTDFIVEHDNYLLHYLFCNSTDTATASLLHMHSNILVGNIEDKVTEILYYDHEEGKRKICKLSDINTMKCDNDIDFEAINECPSNVEKKIVNEELSLRGGMAFVDIDGDNNPDLILSHDKEGKRYIEVYKSIMVNEQRKYCLTEKNIITFDNAEEVGAFTLNKINDEKSQEIAPMLDMLIPLTKKNSILILYNRKKIEYKWAQNYFEVNGYSNEVIQFFSNDEQAKRKTEVLEFTLSNVNEVELDTSLPTIIRAADFLGKANPGLLVNQKVTFNDNTTKNFICLYNRDEGEKKYKLFTHFDLAETGDKSPEPIMGVFFDIDESGSFDIIILTEGKNHFFFNYRREVFFVKSKLMNSASKHYDTDLGTTYRYIVTDKKGDRHMDISTQLIQTSDMNIPLPYSLIGLDQTNNYVEFFHTISSSFYNKKYASVDSEVRNFKQNTPVIPNTQMMIHKFINKKNQIEWSVDLIVQPMDKIWMFLFIVIVVLAIVLVIIIYLHIKEVKEEQKETTKFKSWFA